MQEVRGQVLRTSSFAVYDRFGPKKGKLVEKS